MTSQIDFSGHQQTYGFAKHLVGVAETIGAVDLVPTHRSPSGENNRGVIRLSLIEEGTNGKSRGYLGSHSVVCESSCKRCTNRSNRECGAVNEIRDTLSQIAPHLRVISLQGNSYRISI